MAGRFSFTGSSFLPRALATEKAGRSRSAVAAGRGSGKHGGLCRRPLMLRESAGTGSGKRPEEQGSGASASGKFVPATERTGRGARAFPGSGRAASAESQSSFGTGSLLERPGTIRKGRPRPRRLVAGHAERSASAGPARQTLPGIGQGGPGGAVSTQGRTILSL